MFPFPVGNVKHMSFIARYRYSVRVSRRPLRWHPSGFVYPPPEPTFSYWLDFSPIKPKSLYAYLRQAISNTLMNDLPLVTVLLKREWQFLGLFRGEPIRS